METGHTLGAFSKHYMLLISASTTLPQLGRYQSYIQAKLNQSSLFLPSSILPDVTLAQALCVELLQTRDPMVASAPVW